MHDMLCGTPQVGVISPILSNIALNGLQESVKASIGRKRWRYKDAEGNIKEPNLKVHVVRYADDIIIVAPSEDLIREVILPRVKQFLNNIGLSLNMHKTFTTSIYNRFKFLWFRFFKRKFDYSKVWVKKKHTGDS